MKRILVCGHAGFIGRHLVRRLKDDGHWVAGISRRAWEGSSIADVDYVMDLRNINTNDHAFNGIDEVYQLAGEVGGLGFIGNADNDCLIMRNSLKINMAILEACQYQRISRIFFASSACVYPDTSVHEFAAGYTNAASDLLDTGQVLSAYTKESDAWTAPPTNAFGVEKLFSERLYEAYGRHFGIDVRIARLGNTFGPGATWQGDRAKAPAALCRKVAMAGNNGEVPIWGDGQQARSFLYVDDAIDGILELMAHPEFKGPVNIGSPELVSIDKLAQTIALAAGKKITIKHVPGPVGVRGRASDNTLALEVLGWRPKTPLQAGLKKTYDWVESQLTTFSA